MTTEYKCGHKSKPIFITKDFDFGKYHFWRLTEGFDGLKLNCFECYLKKTRRDDSKKEKEIIIL